MANVTKRVRLILTEADTNHNKQWIGELYDDNTVVTRWGRVGYGEQSKSFPNKGEHYLNKKVTEKLAKGYTEARIVDTEVKIVAPGKITGMTSSELHSIAKSQIIKSSKSAVLDRLIDQLVTSNIHKITSSTNITFNQTTGLFLTPLGAVTLDGISDARKMLDDIYVSVTGGKYDTKLNKLVSDYLRIIPQNIGMKFNVKSIFPDAETVKKQEDILQSLEASYKAITAPKADDKKSDDTKELESVFAIDLIEMPNDSEYKRIESWFETSKRRMHGYDAVKIKNAFIVKIHQMDNRFKKNDPNIKEVFHGTSECNCLSILKSGLKINPPSTVACAGNNFGNGIYGAIHSTKSLGYTRGRWGQSVGASGWLYVCDFAMGKMYEPTWERDVPSGYDSMWAKSDKANLNHDELIVYDETRVNIKYLLECK